MTNLARKLLPAERHVLFGAAISYYSAKARSYLRWKGVDFEERPADATFYTEVCEPRIGRRMIPLVITPDDRAIQDTTLILDHFEGLEDCRPTLTVPGQVQGLVDSLLELYADDWLVVPAMHYRWNYDAEVTTAEIGMTFAPHDPKGTQYELGMRVSGRFRGALPHLGISETTIPSIEASWEASLADLDTHFRQYPFLFGHRPARADFALVGALYAHQYRDATAGALMRARALAVVHYVERMMYPNPYYLGEYVADDVIPETLFPILQRMMSEQMPYLASVVRALDQWRDRNDSEEVPQSLGVAETRVEGVAIERMARAYSVWLLGRAVELNNRLDRASTHRANQLFHNVGGGAFTEIEIRHPLEFTDITLRWK